MATMASKKAYRLAPPAAPSKIEAQKQRAESRRQGPSPADASKRSLIACVSSKDKPVAARRIHPRHQRQVSHLETAHSSLDLVDTDCDELSRDYLKVVSFSDTKGEAQKSFNDNNTTDEDGANTTNELSSPAHTQTRSSSKKTHKMVVRPVTSSILKPQRLDTVASRGSAEVEEPLDRPFLSDMMSQIKHLSGEMRYYEQLMGTRSCFDADGLDQVFNADESAVSQKEVMTYLVHLVCQNMSHLLKSQIDVQKQQEKLDSLSAKMELLLGPSPSVNQEQNLYKHKEMSYLESFQTDVSQNTEFEISPVRADLSAGYKKTAVSLIATPPLSPSAGDSSTASSLVQSSLMNGSSPSDWLFHHNFSTPVASQPLRMPNSRSLSVIPSAPVKAALASRAAEPGDVLDSGRFAEVTRNLDSKFAAVSPPSVPLSHSLVSPPRPPDGAAVSYEEARTGLLYNYALGLLDSPSAEADSSYSLPASSLPSPAPKSRHPYY